MSDTIKALPPFNDPRVRVVYEVLCDTSEAGSPPTAAEHWEGYTARRIVAALAAQEQAEPMFWVRICSDGSYEGPIHNSAIERVRKASGAWSPLYTHTPAAKPAQSDHFPDAGNMVDHHTITTEPFHG